MWWHRPGYAGLAAALAIVTEFQGDGAPHGHGFVALHNMFQYENLERIGDLIDRNIHVRVPLEMVCYFVLSFR